jgi:2-hydroxychromene-2-carboxylate isomerase
MKTLDFYFDFMSPFAYLASTQLPRLVDRHGITLVLHPIDLVAARRAAGNTGPFNRDIPAKMKYLMADLQRWAQRYGVPFTMPKGLDTARLNRGVLWARTQGQAAETRYFHAAYAAVWGRSGDPADPELLRAAAREAGLSPEECLRGADADSIRQAYDKENREAQARGVFGVPIFIVDDQMYWGNDRLEFLEEYLRS